MRKLWLALSCLPLVAACARDGSVPVDGELADRVAHAVDLGRVAPSTPLQFLVGVAVPAPESLHKYVRESAGAGDYVIPAEFARRFAAPPDDYARIVDWLAAGGATVMRTTDGRTTVTAGASAAVVERLFSVEVHEYSDAEGTFVAAATPLRVPAEMVADILGIVGLSGSGGWQPHFYFPDLSAGARLLPSDMHTLYGSDGISTPGMGETVAILGSGSPPNPTVDVGGYMTDFKPYGVTTANSYQQLLIDGPTRDAPSDAANEYFENVLDAEMVLAMAPYANVLHVLVATNTPGLFSDGISYIVNQHPEAHAVTVSYGSCERGIAQETAVIDTLLEQAMAEGQTWFFAAGDSGTDGCRDGSGNHHVAAGWPASSPFAVGVGGTMIGAGGVEVAWNENGANGEAAGGGGPSEIFTKPPWQEGKTPADGARDTPDLSAIAGGGGVWVAAQGKHGGVGGTSVAAPVCAGAWALVDQGKGGTGLPGALARIYAVGTSGFNDVTSGDNGGPDGMSPGYPAGAGYDLATGWGSPNVAKLIASIQ